MVVAPASVDTLCVNSIRFLQEVLAEQGWSAELTAQQSQWGLMTIRRS